MREKGKEERRGCHDLKKYSLLNKNINIFIYIFNKIALNLIKSLCNHKRLHTVRIQQQYFS